MLKHSIPLSVLFMLSACTAVPNGPSMLVLPGTGKSFDQFRADDTECRQYASQQIGGETASSTATESGVRSAAVGTAVGAVAGAVIGGERGVGMGAGTGLLMGSMAGTGAADISARTLQQRYDFGYEQCMYAKGHRIPAMEQYGASSRRPPQYIPPPPPGMPPPPPPGAAP